MDDFLKAIQYCQGIQAIIINLIERISPQRAIASEDYERKQGWRVRLALNVSFLVIYQA